MQGLVQEERRWGLNGFTLKWIAMLTMLIDHTGMVLFPQYRIFRIVGRLAFPIYCFLLVEGAVHTSNWKKYVSRLILFALISEIPFDLARSGQIVAADAQNVFFTLSFGLLAVIILKEQKNRFAAWTAALALILTAEFLRTDYGGGGVMIILIFYLLREHMAAKSLCFGAEIFWGSGGIENYALLALVPIVCYNGKKGPGGLKYLFYVFYPAHLFGLYGLSRWTGAGGWG